MRIMGTEIEVRCKNLLKEIRETMQTDQENTNNNQKIFVEFCQQLIRWSQQEKMDFRFNLGDIYYELSLACAGSFSRKHYAMSIHAGKDGFDLNGKKIEIKSPEDILKLFAENLVTIEI